ncbi:MAG: Putative transport protein [Thermoanaerobacterales bacterium 50_218]|nr:MAG: Putative transport protein [Thermoanaerobacterales bacterium 50_218]
MVLEKNIPGTELDFFSVFKSTTSLKVRKGDSWFKKGLQKVVNGSGHEATKRAALVVATLSALLTPFMGSAANIALPTIAREFALDAVTLSWVATSYLLAAVAFLVPFGRIADIYGRKKVFLFGTIIYTVASLLSALSFSAPVLIFSRVIQGIGGSMIFATGVAILTSVYPPNERGRVLGINVASVYLGLSIGPFLGGFLTEHFGWRSIFWAVVPLGGLIILVTLGKLKGEWMEAQGEKFDYTGSLLNCLMFLALIYGFSLLPATSGWYLVLLGLLGIFLFVKYELSTESPVIDIRLFRNNSSFAFSNLAALINYSATFAVGFILSLYLQYLKGLSAQRAGLILVSQPVVQAVFSPFAGRLSDQIEPRIIASAGMGITFIGLVLLTFLRANTPLWFIILSLIVLGLGFAFFSSPNTNAIMSAVDRKFYGVASGILGTMRLTGQMLSMGIIMLILALFMGRTQITSQNLPLFLKSSQIAFIVFAVLCFWGIFASLARGNMHDSERSSQETSD